MELCIALGVDDDAKPLPAARAGKIFGRVSVIVNAPARRILLATYEIAPAISPAVFMVQTSGLFGNL